MGNMASDIVPILAMIIVQVGYAGMTITSKLAMESGMNLLVLVTYRQIIGALAIIPFALWLERKVRPRMTLSIFFQIFVCSLTGATGNQVLYFVGLRNSTPTVACAINNVLPAITFILAAICRQESVGIRTRRGQVKVIGTLVGIGGALVLSFYHGKSIGLGESKIHWKYADKLTQETNSADKGNFMLGSFAVIASCVCLSIWFIVQTKLSQKFPAPYTSSSFMCILSSIQCALIALCFEHRPSAWSLTDPMRLTSSLYSGIVCNGIAFCLLSWTIQRKGPLFASTFNPLLLVIVAFLSWALLREKLYVGTAVGSLLIVIGLYAVLWGKKEEMKFIEGMEETELGMKDNKQVQLDCTAVTVITLNHLFKYDAVAKPLAGIHGPEEVNNGIIKTFDNLDAPTYYSSYVNPLWKLKRPTPDMTEFEGET